MPYYSLKMENVGGEIEGNCGIPEKRMKWQGLEEVQRWKREGQPLL
jgi:hypothetical protein